MRLKTDCVHINLSVPVVFLKYPYFRHLARKLDNEACIHQLAEKQRWQRERTKKLNFVFSNGAVSSQTSKIAAVRPVNIKCLEHLCKKKKKKKCNQVYPGESKQNRDKANNVDIEVSVNIVTDVRRSGL